MPIYEFQCDHCRVTFDEIRPMSGDHTFAACSECGRTAWRVYNAPSLITEPKGDGYFEGRGYRSNASNR